MKNKIRLAIYISLSGFFLLLDQLLKHFARANADFSYYLWKPWLGWEYYANPGIAFSFPFPNWLIIIATPIIILGILFWYLKSKTCKLQAVNYKLSAVSLVIAGALSNYIDRILFSATIDYLRFFTGVINLADVMIVGGVLLLIICSQK